MNRRTCFFALLVVFLASFSVQADDEVPKVPGYTGVQLGRGRQNHLLIESFINGEKVTFAVDTGAPVSVILPGSVKRLKLNAPKPETPIPSTVKVGGQTLKVVWLPNLVAGKMLLGAGPMAVLDLKHSRGMFYGQRYGTIDGLIGADILSRYQAVLFCGTKQVLFRTNSREKSNLSASMIQAGYLGVRMESSLGHLTVPCVFHGRKYHLIVDTGAFVTLLEAAEVKALGLKIDPSHLRTSGQLSDNEKMGILDAKDNQLSIADIPVTVDVGVFHQPALQEEGQRAGKNILGLLGADVLAIHNAVVDFGTNTFYFHPAPPRK